jgi:neural Wiskott-Aldrich syndrome protein
MNDISAGYAELPRTAYLDHTLRRARNAAEQRSHRYVTLEHLLFALLDDPDAVRVLQGVGADIAVIHSAISDGVNNRMASLVVPDGRAPTFSYKFDTLILRASEDSMRLGRRDVDGAMTLIAVAKDPESNASAILAANGFAPEAALRYLAGLGVPAQREPQAAPPQPLGQAGESVRAANMPAPQQPSPISTPQAAAFPARPNVASQDASMPPADDNMEDMLTSVRNILEAEERRERGLLPASHSLAPSSPHRGAQPRLEPQLRADGSRDHPVPRANPAYQGQDRMEPSLGQGYHQPPRSPAQTGSQSKFAEPPAPTFDLETAPPAPARQQDKRRKPGRGRSETPSLVTKLLGHIPRKARVAVAETVEILLSREEAAMIFGRPARRGQPQQDHDAPMACRAVTVRMSAPEGGFFIDAPAPETQWVFDRPSFLGDEAFGRWAWTLIPNESGSYNLTVQISARDIDENGLAGDLNLPEQVIAVRIRGNFWRGLGRLLRTVFVLLAGSGLTVGVYYALKIMGKLPH